MLSKCKIELNTEQTEPLQRQDWKCLIGDFRTTNLEENLTFFHTLIFNQLKSPFMKQSQIFSIPQTLHVQQLCNSLLFSKVDLSPSKKGCFICSNGSSLKLMNAFYFILKTFFALKITKFLSSLFGHVEKRACQRDKVNFKIMTSQPG